MSKQGLDLWLDIKDQELYKVVGLKYVKKILNIRYGMKNYNNKAKCKVRDKSYGRLEET